MLNRSHQPVKELALEYSTAMAHVRLCSLCGEVLTIQRIGPHPKLQELEIATP
jgi:hypothetical protein